MSDFLEEPIKYLIYCFFALGLGVGAAFGFYKLIVHFLPRLALGLLSGGKIVAFWLLSLFITFAFAFGLFCLILRIMSAFEGGGALGGSSHTSLKGDQPYEDDDSEDTQEDETRENNEERLSKKKVKKLFSNPRNYECGTSPTFSWTTPPNDDCVLHYQNHATRASQTYNGNGAGNRHTVSVLIKHTYIVKLVCNGREVDKLKVGKECK